MKETWRRLVVVLQSIAQWINWAFDSKTERWILSCFQRIRILPALWEAKLWVKCQSPNFLLMVCSTETLFNLVSNTTMTLTSLQRRKLYIAWCFRGKLKPLIFQEAIIMSLDGRKPPRPKLQLFDFFLFRHQLAYPQYGLFLWVALFFTFFFLRFCFHLNKPIFNKVTILSVHCFC